MAPKAAPAYEYLATALRLIDGDTFEVRVDLGFRAFIQTPLRLLGVNAPEKNTPQGQLAKEWTQGWLDLNEAWTRGLWIKSAHPGVYGDKYGRWLAVVRSMSMVSCLNDDILKAGHAVVLKF